MMRSDFLLAALASLAAAAILTHSSGLVQVAHSAPATGGGGCPREARSAHGDKQGPSMHNHISRKVFDRACAASKDTIDEVIACLTSNEGLMKAVKADTAQNCYKDSFNLEFNAKDVIKHKELICNNREKFENMTTCIYKKTAELLDDKEMDRLTETLVDVGMCIINALDG